MKYPTRPGLGLLFAVACLPLCAPAQTREQGPWWPSALWGAADQAGSSNWITPEKILAAAKLVKTGKLYELGHPYEQGMPLNGQRSYKLTIPSFPTHGPVVSAGREVYFNDEFVAAEIGQVGTQFDGPGHVSQAVTMANGEKKIVFYNGFTADELKNPYGLRQLGVEHVKPIFTRGLLLDIAALRGVEILPEGYVVSLADIHATLAREGISEKDIQPGDALLFNFGWWKHWPNKISVEGKAPYISDEVIAWIIARQPSMIGSDTNLDGPEFNVHTELILKHGIFNLELMTFDHLAQDKVYEFLFVFTPVPFKGATGSPGRPIAIR